jgi:hypothetical protein
MSNLWRYLYHMALDPHPWGFTHISVVYFQTPSRFLATGKFGWGEGLGAAINRNAI